MGSDAILAPVVDGADVDPRPLQVAPSPLGFGERLVAEGYVLGRQALVVGAEQELAVEMRLACNSGLVDAQLAGAGAAQEALEDRLGPELAVQLCAALGGAHLVRGGNA